MEKFVDSLVLFDGECNLCNHSVQFILRRDSAKRFHFAALQSPVAQQLLQQAGQESTFLPDSVVLVERGKVYTKSTAALKIAQNLGGLWLLMAVLLLIPAFVRDWGYDLIARNRYRLFGRRESCLMPTAEIRERFLSE